MRSHRHLPSARLALLASLVFCAVPTALSAGDDGLRVAFLVQGKVGGEDIAAPAQQEAARKLEAMLAEKFRGAFGVQSFNQEALDKARADKEQWAVLTGGGTTEVQKVLEAHKLDALVRVYFRTAVIHLEEQAAFLGTAVEIVEILSFKTGEKAVLTWSPAMGALDTSALHKPQQGADAFAASMAALAYATDRTIEDLQKDAGFQALLGKAPAAPAGEDPLRVIFVMEEGRIRGEGIGAEETRVGSARLEATLAAMLKQAVGIHSFDDAVLKEVRKNAEQWAVLTKGDTDAVRKALANHRLDAVIRVYYRTAPAYRMGAGKAFIYSGTASVMAEIINIKTGEKSVLIESPPMGNVEHPAKRALDPFDASMTALDYAATEMIANFKQSPALRRLQEQQAPSETAVDPESQRVLFILKGQIAGEDIQPMEQRVGAMHLESVLDQQLRQALHLKNFDDQALRKIRQQAEEWAVLLGGEVSEVQKVLEKHNVDSLVQVNYKTDVAFTEKDKDGNALYTATATIQTDIVSRKTQDKRLSFQSPPMGRTAVDPFDAGVGALELATGMMVEKLQADLGIKQLMDGPKKAETPVQADPGKPTVAVLWIRPSANFKPWFGGRSRQPGQNMKKREQIRQFVEYMKSTQSLGMEISHYLVQGIVASGALAPVEQSGKTQEEIGEVQNKLLEYRMAGWVGEKLPFNDPVQVAKAVGADYVVTALLDKIYENSSAVNFAQVVSGGSVEAVAEVEVTITQVATGQSATHKGKGSFKKSGYGTVMAFDPKDMKLDKFLIGGAIKEALYEAAKQIRPF